MEYTDGSVKYKIEKIGGGSPTGSVTAYAGDTVPYGCYCVMAQTEHRT